MNGATAQIVFLVIIMGAMWFLLIRPQQQQKKTHASMVAQLTVGTRIVTVGGVVGEITELHEDTIVIETADETLIEFVRDAVGRVLEPADFADDEEPDEEELDTDPVEQD